MAGVASKIDTFRGKVLNKNNEDLKLFLGSF